MEAINDVDVYNLSITLLNDLNPNGTGLLPVMYRPFADFLWFDIHYATIEALQ